MIFLEKQIVDVHGGERDCPALIASDEESDSRLGKMGKGQKVRVEVKLLSDRSHKQHKLFFGMLTTTFNNQEQFQTTESLREALLMEAGHTEMREKLNGERYYVARSISYRESQHEEFNDLVDRVRAIIEAQWGFDPLGER